MKIQTCPKWVHFTLICSFHWLLLVLGKGFASGRINLGGLEMCQVSTFTKVWATLDAGQNNLGAKFFKPSQIPEGLYMLGYYSQPNNKPLFGWVLVAKGESDGDIEGGEIFRG